MTDNGSPRYLKSGISENTPGSITFGAGVLVKNLKWENDRKVQTTDTTPQSGKTYYHWYQDKWEKDESLEAFGMFTYYEQIPGWNYNTGTRIGATKDGTKLSIVPEYSDIDVDGCLVKMKGLAVKIGETAIITTTLVENTAENAALVLNGVVSNKSKLAEGAGSAPNNHFKVVTSRADVTVDDYITNLALVANRMNDKEPVVVIFKNALCTSGFEIESKNKEASAFQAKFECYADLSSDAATNLPYEIIYPNLSTSV